MAIFQNNLGKPVPECVSILDFIGAQGEGGDGDSWSLEP